MYIDFFLPINVFLKENIDDNCLKQYNNSINRRIDIDVTPPVNNTLSHTTIKSENEQTKKDDVMNDFNRSRNNQETSKEYLRRNLK
jgi:hypothetical protein